MAQSLGHFIPEPLHVYPLGAPRHKTTNRISSVMVTATEQPQFLLHECAG